MEIIVKTLFGLEEVLADEIRELGGKDIKILNRAVSFEGGPKEMYRANLELRTALNVLVPIHKFRIKSEKDLYVRTKEFKWHELIGTDNTIAVACSVNSKIFNHSQYPALVVKDAIVDKLRNKFGKRPDVDRQNPDYSINLHVYKEDAAISLDSSGDSLHKRGYRTVQTDAPLNEVLAAGMLELTGWKGESDLYDPMCGSGTFTLEAMTKAMNIPPGFKRNFGFQLWKDFDKQLWDEVYHDAMSKRTEPDCAFKSSDISGKAVSVTKANLTNAGFREYSDVFMKNFFELKPESSNGIVFLNPPYDERMETEDAIDFYKKTGDKLKTDFTGFNAFIISGNLEALKHVGLKPAFRKPLYNGKIETRFNKYELYKGSR